MAKPQRTFVGKEGNLSIGTQGPSALIADIDNINRMFDPDVTGGGINYNNIRQGGVREENLAADAVTNSKIKNNEITHNKLVHNDVAANMPFISFGHRDKLYIYGPNRESTTVYNNPAYMWHESSFINISLDPIPLYVKEEIETFGSPMEVYTNYIHFFSIRIKRFYTVIGDIQRNNKMRIKMRFPGVAPEFFVLYQEASSQSGDNPRNFDFVLPQILKDRGVNVFNPDLTMEIRIDFQIDRNETGFAFYRYDYDSRGTELWCNNTYCIAPR